MKKCLFSILSILITLSNYAQNVGINTTPSSPPTNTLDVNGTLRVRGGTPGTGKVLTSDANGVGSWSTPSANYPRISYDAILALPSPTKGDIAYDNTFDCLRVYTGSKWICTYQNPSNFTPNIIAIASGGGGSYDNGTGIAVDASGNVYITGFYNGTATFGTSTITSIGGYDIFVAKYNNTGTLQWVQSAGGTGAYDGGFSLTVDGLGNVYVLGNFEGTANFGGTFKTSAGGLDIFVAKYNSSGMLQWVQSAGGSSFDNGTSIAVDGSGSVYLTGYYQGIANFGGTLKSSAGNYDIFIAKYNSGGTLQWVQSAGGTGDDEGKSIAVDASGNVYLTGFFNGTANFDGTPKTSAGGSDIFIVKYNSSGNFQWVQSGGGTSYDIGNSITIDGLGNVYITGYFSGTATYGANIITSVGGPDIIVLKYNSVGTFLWVQSAGGTDGDYGNSIAIDGLGNIYLTGYFSGTAAFGTNNKTSSGNADIFVAKYNSSGTVQWVQSAGGTSDDIGTNIAVDGSGNVYITGSYQGTATFGSTIKTSAGSLDIFVARLDK